MRHFLFILLLCLPFYSLSAFQGDKDSLISLLKVAQQDTGRISILLELCAAESVSPEEAQSYALEAFTLANKLNSALLKAKALNRSGTAYRREKLYDKALGQYELALKAAEGAKNLEAQYQAQNGIANANYSIADFEAALIHAFEALKLAEELKQDGYYLNTGNLIGIIYSDTEEHEEALPYFFKNLEMGRASKDQNNIVVALNNIGYSFDQLGRYEEALTYLFEALKISQQMEDKSEQSAPLNSIGNVFKHQGVYNEALNYLTRDAAICKETGDDEGMAYSLSDLGDTHILMGKNKEGLAYLSDALLHAQKSGSHYVLKYCYDNLHKAYVKTQMWREAHESFLKFQAYKDTLSSTETLQKIKKAEIKSITATKQHEIELQQIRLEEKNSELFTQRIISVGVLLGIVAIGIMLVALYNSNKNKQAANDLLAESHAKIKSQNIDLERSYQVMSMLSAIGQELTATLNFESIFAKLYENIHRLMDTSYFGVDIYHADKGKIEFKFDIENDLRLPNESVAADDPDNLTAWCIRNKQEIFTNDYPADYEKYTGRISTVVGESMNSIIYCPLMIEGRVLGAISVQSLQKNAYTDFHLNILRTLGTYTAIALDNAQAYSKIQGYNLQIKSSINYALRIQEVLLPRRSDIEKHLPESFVVYKPRDVVSGDFYWFATVKEKIILASVDCTGHGVPGAFMSMIGDANLNQIVNIKGVWEPEKILGLLHEGIRKALKQDVTTNRDGMDMAVVSIDKSLGTLEFAGAKSPMIFVQNEIIQKLKGDKFPIGGYQKEDSREFTKHTITFSKQGKNMFYLFSDGYTDQFGGPFDKKFGTRRLMDLIESIYTLPIDEQREIMNKSIEKWMGETKQIDDIMVIGFRV